MDSLPNEILLEILQHLTYGDLRLRVPLVNKRFFALLQPTPGSATEINRILFCDAPLQVPRSSSTAYAVNPTFNAIDYGYTTSIDYVTLRRTHKRLAESPAGAENAVSPAFKKAVYHHPWVGVPPFLDVEGTGNGGAVTVLDVMQAAVEIARRCKESHSNGIDYEILDFFWGGFKTTNVDAEGVFHFHDGGGAILPGGHSAYA